MPMALATLVLDLPYPPGAVLDVHFKRFGPHVLVLGGTGEAVALARLLDERGVGVTTSLAGRTPVPRFPPGQVRVGGFGGPDGLAAWLAEHRVHAVVDATHPFSERISASTRAACAAVGAPLLRLGRPGWTAQEGDRWSWAATLEEAAERVDELGTRVLLTTGRQGLGAFAAVRAWVLVRCLQAPDPPLPARARVLLDRGPFTLAGERALLAEHAIDLVVTKDSGGPQTQAKLVAARERGLPVLLVARGEEQGDGGVASVAEAAAWAMMAR